jgi:asparagine synthase (glutamine-hydrolysing)
VCGICGVASSDPRATPVSSSQLTAMTRAMTHRGPDEEGYLSRVGIALGMRRLSIIDIAGSHQPATNETATVHAVFNGEIYNFPELREDLQRRAHRLTTSGDTETIVHLYEDYGVDCLRHLRGMFSIALWDEPKRRLMLARDRLGVKPLYYSVLPDKIAFASEIKCLLVGGLVTPKLDTVAAELFLALGYVPGPRTLFAGVSKLPPATLLEWQAGQLGGPRIYWTPHDDPPFISGSWREDEEHLLELLRSSVRARMISDVPLGVMLSGGLDSSLIAALMAEASPQPVESFSIGFVEDANANELQWARKTATRLGTRHHELLTSASEHAGLLDDALWHLEEPIADLSFLGFLLLSRLARESVTVALCGQAADELLAGYPKHRAAHVADILACVPTPARRVAATVANHLNDRSNLHRMLSVLASDDDVERLIAMSRVTTPALRDGLGGPALGNGDPDAILREGLLSHADGKGGSRLGRTLMLDLKLALPDLMFLYFDKMSMATSLEVRVPFADHDLVSFCAALPDKRRMRLLRGKEILRHVSRDLVDESIINRPKRGFFRAASSSWLRQHEPIVRETLLDQRCRNRGVLNAATVSDWLDRPIGEARGGEPLLATFLLERWHRLFVDSDGLGHRHSDAAREAAPAVP